jgi:transglutaminase-like putative cysteine protease
MILAIDYAAVYSYAAPVSLSVHDVRIFPRPDSRLRVRRQEFACPAAGGVRFRRDAYDNLVANCFFPDPVTELAATLALEVEIPAQNPFDFLLEDRAITLPIGYTASERTVLAPFLAIDARQPLPEPLVPTNARPTVDTLVAANHWLHEAIAYERREEGDPLPIAETLSRGRGSCRDVAVILLEALRQNGVAARLAAGFVWEGDLPVGERRAETAMHAWVEAYLPGAGWTGLDPTNGVFCDHHFLPVAVGLTPAEIAPVVGTYFQNDSVASTLATRLTVTRR